MKYTLEELIELSKGVFEDDKSASAYYAHPNGTFKNEEQFNALSTTDRKDYHRIENPNAKKAEAPGDEHKKLDELIEAIDGLQKDLAVEKGTNKTLADELAGVKSDNSRLASEIGSLNSVISSTKSELSSSASQLREANQEIESLNKQLAESGEEKGAKEAKKK